MSETVELIVNYGVFPVLAALIIFVIIRVFKSQQKSMESLQEANREQEERLSRILETILSIGRNTNPVHTPQEEEDNSRINLLINSQLQKCMEDAHSNRAGCYLYHNGGKDASGRSFQKMSMSHECVDANTVPVMSSYQNVPRMMFPVLVQKLTEQGYYYIPNIEDIKESDPVIYQSLLSRGTKAAFMQAIRQTDGLILGFISVEFSTNTFSSEEEIKKALINKAVKISGALELKTDNVIQGGSK